MAQHTSNARSGRTGLRSRKPFRIVAIFRRLGLPPAVTTAVGVAGFVTSGIAVVATASLIALQIQ